MAVTAHDGRVSALNPSDRQSTEARRNFAAQVSLITRLLRKRFDERARTMALPSGETITRAQWRMLGAIHLYEGSTQRDIAERLEIGAATAGQTIDRLEEAQLVERRAHPADRRAKRLYTTDAALSVLSTLGLLGSSEDQRAIVGIPAEDMNMLTSLLDDVIQNLMAPDAPLP